MAEPDTCLEIRLAGVGAVDRRYGAEQLALSNLCAQINAHVPGLSTWFRDPFNPRGVEGEPDFINIRFECSNLAVVIVSTWYVYKDRSPVKSEFLGGFQIDTAIFYENGSWYISQTGIECAIIIPESPVLLKRIIERLRVV